ncbi:MAG: serine hydrolase domain-containing protein [Thermoleophilia bacterium]
MHLARPRRLPLALTLAACAVGARLALATPSAHATARPEADATSTPALAPAADDPSHPARQPELPRRRARRAPRASTRAPSASPTAKPTRGSPRPRAFRIASITKTFTAAAILRPRREGRPRPRRPDRPPPLPADPRAPTRRRLRPARDHAPMLLQHTSGIADFASDPAYLASVAAQPRHRGPAEQIRFATTHDDPLGAPGSSFHYSDTGYLLGETIERASGLQPHAYRTLLSLDQLGLDHTYPRRSSRPRRHHPRMHQYLATADSWALDPSFDLYGSGGLVSTLDDLARFYRALLTGHVLARPASLRAMRGAAHPTAVDQLGPASSRSSSAARPATATRASGLKRHLLPQEPHHHRQHRQPSRGLSKPPAPTSTRPSTNSRSPRPTPPTDRRA